MLAITYRSGEVVRVGVSFNGQAHASVTGEIAKMHLERDRSNRHRAIAAPPSIREHDLIQLDEDERKWLFGIDQPVWDESWDNDEGLIVAGEDWCAEPSRFAWEQQTNLGAFGDCASGRFFDSQSRDAARAKLAARAPAMARLLLRLRDDQPSGEQRAIDAVLRDAGVLP